MSEDFQEVAPQAEQGTKPPAETAPITQKMPSGRGWLEMLAQLGLGETVTRLGTNVLTFLLVLVVVWLMRSFYHDVPLNAPSSGRALAAQPTATPPVELAAQPEQIFTYPGISRLALIHTTIPNRPRQEIEKYTVQAGDTVFGIAEKWGLKPQTILWGNYYTLRDDPHNLHPGQELNILPVNGTYYEWQPGDGLNGVSKFFGVTPEEIINYPANRLDPVTIGDYSNPNIKPGTWLIVPGGSRQFISWSAPIGVTRENPAVARQMGPGACGTITDGAVGFGTFIWPSNKHYLSGFDYSPETNHRGIDIAGSTGEGVYAADAGVIVYAGWNDWGYGNMIVIDHGNGWQTLYAHLSGINVLCGESVGQGQVIGAIGSTGASSGSHLHFEMMNTQYGKVNPWLYLPSP
jgi:hypothetical protein